MMLHTKHQASKRCGFRQDDFFMFLPIKAYVKPVTPGLGPILAQGYNLNKLGRDLPDDILYQISKFFALWFKRRRLFHVSPYKSLCKPVTPGAKPFLALML